jgi:hypothetical protein
VTEGDLRLVPFLRAGDEAVQDFGKYVATTTYRVCHDYLSEKHPGRRRLKTRLRYLKRPAPLWLRARQSGPACMKTWMSYRDVDVSLRVDTTRSRRETRVANAIASVRSAGWH